LNIRLAVAVAALLMAWFGLFTGGVGAGRFIEWLGLV